MNNSKNKTCNIYSKCKINKISDNQNIIIRSVKEKNKNIIQHINSDTNVNTVPLYSSEQILEFINNYNQTFSKNSKKQNIFFVVEISTPTIKEQNKLLREREKEVLSSLALGKQYNQIAKTLFISVHTVHYHIIYVYIMFILNLKSLTLH